MVRFLVDVASASVDQLNAQLRQANSFHDNGTVSRDDVLRAQLAVANAEQRRIAARSRVTLGRAQLALYMGLSPDSPIDATPMPSDRALAPDATPLAQAEKTAEAERVELQLPEGEPVRSLGRVVRQGAEEDHKGIRLDGIGRQDEDRLMRFIRDREVQALRQSRDR